MEAPINSAYVHNGETQSRGITMLATKITSVLAIGASLAAATIACHKKYHSTCCIADYDLIIPTTACKCSIHWFPNLDSQDAGVPSSEMPICSDGIDTNTTWFETW